MPQYSTKYGQTPEPYKWSEDFAVFYAQLDDEHKGLFDGIFALDKNHGDADALKTLQSNTATHFRNEEAKMKKNGYPQMDSHIKLHHKFEEILNGLSCPVSEDNLKFAKVWLCEHIKEHDFQYKGKLDA